MEEIIEQIIERLEGNKMKDMDLYEYVDANIDNWSIDIGNYFLDDIVDQASALIKKRAKLGKKEADDGIVFKEDEEQAEKRHLRIVERQYDDIYLKACNIEKCELGTSIASSLACSIPSGSWKDVLDRIDILHSRK